MKNPQQYIRDRVRLSSSGCWVWTKARCGKRGYGVCGIGTRTYRVHRLSYEAFVGPIADGLLVMHVCDCRLCCNPEHLRLGTAKENTNDMREKGRMPMGVMQGGAVLTDELVREIRLAYVPGVTTQREIASRYGIDQGGVSRIVRRKLWPHVD